MKQLSRDNFGEIGKKGIEQQFLVILILTILGFLIILGFAVRTGYISNVEADTNLCRVTLAAQELSQIRVSRTGIVMDSPLSTACKRRTVNVMDDGIFSERRGPDQKLPVYLKQQSEATLLKGTTNYDLEESKSQAYRQEVLASYFSESMRRCWLRSLEGEVEVFNDETTFKTANVCMLCDETHVSLGAAQNTKGAWLSTYIQGTVMPGDVEKRTYGEYLFTINDAENSAYANFFEALVSVGTGGAIHLLGLSSDASRFTNNAQFVCITENNINMNPVIRDGSYATIFFRDFSKFQTGCMAVAVVPAQQVRSLCDYVAN